MRRSAQRPEPAPGVLDVRSRPVDASAPGAGLKPFVPFKDIRRDAVFRRVPRKFLKEDVAPQAAAEILFRLGYQPQLFQDLFHLPLNPFIFDHEQDSLELPSGKIPFSRQYDPVFQLGFPQEAPVCRRTVVKRIIPEHAQPQGQLPQVDIRQEFHGVY